MGFLGKILAEGELTSTITPIYTVQDNQTAYIKYFRVFCDIVSQEKIEVLVQKSGSPLREMYDFTLKFHESADLIDKDSSLVMSPGDKIYAFGSGPSGVHYIISGGLEIS